MVSLSESVELSIGSHDCFFARIIDMIPRDLYRPAEEEDEEVLNKRYHKHRKMPLQTDERKALSKKRLKDIYDPEEPKGSAEEEMEVEEEVVLAEEVEDDNENPSADDGLDALRKRLQDRITSLRGNRATSERGATKKQKGKQVQKNKPAKTGSAEAYANDTADEVAKQVSRGVLDDMMATDGHDESVEAGGDIIYSGLVDNDVGAVRADSGKSGSKLRRLKKLIEDTENKKKHLNDLKSLGEAGKEQALQEQWTDVLKEATGNKVLANTAKIKKTIKRKEKAKEKSAREWAERKATEEAAFNKKYDKRDENLLKRKRGPDWVLSAEEEAKEKEKKEEKKKGVPIKARFGNNNKNKSGDGKSGGDAKGGGDGGKKGRAGFEGKKVDFLNKKQRK